MIGDDLSHIGRNDKIKFESEVQRYNVICRNTRYIICTKPFNCMKTVLYTVIDVRLEIRGTEDLVFCAGAETYALCLEMLSRLGNTTEVSRRNRVPLDIERVDHWYKIKGGKACW